MIMAGTDVTFSWDFGDGTQGSGAVVSHLYTGVGVYTGVVTAVNSVSIMTATTMIVVQDVPIDGLVVDSNSPVQLGEAVLLTATISSGSHVTYSWDFGDGELGSGAMVSHTYGAAGSYNVMVTATNSVGKMVVSVVVNVYEEEQMTWFVYMPVMMKP
jgi:PKD repeat protein